MSETTSTMEPITGEKTPNAPETLETPEKPQTQDLEKLPKIADPQTLRLFYDPPGTLRLTVGQGDGSYSYQTVRLYQAAPLSFPGQYLSLQNGKGEEIVMVNRLEEFNQESQPVAAEELKRRYLTATVQGITGIKTEFGITYWHVLTDRGERDFVIQSLSESCVWLSDTHILLIDSDGNRFEIPDRTRLDAASQEHLATVL